MRVAATVLLVVAGVALLASLALLVMPNSVEIGPSNVVYFDCGSALSPTPHFEPGFGASAACAAENDNMRQASLSFAWAAALAAFGAALIYRIDRHR